MMPTNRFMSLQLPLEIQQRLDEHLEWMKIEPAVVLDLGYGQGLAEPLLKARYPRARHLALDLNPKNLPQKTTWSPFHLLKKTSQTFGIGGNAEAIPLKSQSIDLVHSNLLLPCCDSLAVIREVARVLKPGGLFLFSSLGPDSFSQLRQAGLALKDFTDMHDLGDQMVEAGLANPVVNRDDIVFTYGEPATLIRDLEGWGFEYYLNQPSPVAWHHLLENISGKLELTLEAVFAHAWKPLPPKGLEGKRIIPIKAPR